MFQICSYHTQEKKLVRSDVYILCKPKFQIHKSHLLLCVWYSLCTSVYLHDIDGILDLQHPRSDEVGQELICNGHIFRDWFSVLHYALEIYNKKEC